jgi:Domain of unknown function (DUF4412)
MKRLFAIGLFTLVSVLPGFHALAQANDNPLAGAPTQFSADMVVTRKAGSPRTMRLYADGNKRRTEEDTNGGTVAIVRGDRNKMYFLSTAGKTYQEYPLNPALTESISDRVKQLGVVSEKLGTETIDGELCDKYHYSSDPKNAAVKPDATGSKRSISGTIWISQVIHLPVKVENEAGTTEWKNIKVGPPEASLFELPADYKKSGPGAGK